MPRPAFLRAIAPQNNHGVNRIFNKYSILSMIIIAAEEATFILRLAATKTMYRLLMALFILWRHNCQVTSLVRASLCTPRYRTASIQIFPSSEAGKVFVDSRV